ncbi:MAG: efflux RND transporter periplasmic adaptor subunit [Acidobacteria bacterium]|nr:efflux RND transporter periplasmic adaptor subunit [Acidobacteriota bacterium]
MLCPSSLFAHGEIEGAGEQSFTRIVENKGQKYRIDLMYSPSLPTAGEPANAGIDLMRLLATPDPLLGSEVPITEIPEVALVDQKSGRIVIEHLPFISEPKAGAFEFNEYKFPKSGSFLLRIRFQSPDGDLITEDFPITVQPNAAATFRFWVNLAVIILILGLTAMQLRKVRARGGEFTQMVRPAAAGLISLVVVVLAMDRFILGAVLDLRKPPPAAPAAGSVTTNEDGSYTIPAAIQQELGLSLVEAKEVSLGQIVTAYGTVEARPDLTAIVQAPLWGRIEWAKDPLAVGDRVKKGQELVQVVLELNALERGVMEAKDVDIKGAKKRVEDRRNAARLEYDRWKALHAKNPAYEADENWAKQLFDQATADYNEVVKQDAAYQAIMKWRNPRRTPVASPINGVITTVDFVPGELNITADYRNLFTIVDASQVWVRAQVFLADVSKLKDGDTPRVFPVNTEAKPLAGKVRWIGDTIDPVNRTVPVLVDISNEGQFFALGSFARLEFEQPRQVLAVPEQAVVDEGTSRWVYVAREQGTFAPVQVELGLKQGGWWQVTSGLMVGDQVIAKGAALLGSMPRPQEIMLETSPAAPAAAASTQLSEASTSHRQ